jgi:hypothetical protein
MTQINYQAKGQFSYCDEHTVMHMMGYEDSFDKDTIKDAIATGGVCIRTLLYLCYEYERKWGSNSDINDSINYLKKELGSQ